MSENSKLLEVKNLDIVFRQNEKSLEVVKDVSFNLKKGEILGIVGESGSGKSLTCLSLIKLIPKGGDIVSGNVKLQDANEIINITDASEKEMCSIRGRSISMVFQEPMSSLNPTHRCGKQVEEALLIHFPDKRDISKKLVLELFEEVRLDDAERIYRSYPHELSGGQLQRVMIAIALINKPSIIIADEPTTALDVTIQKEIIELISDIRKKYGCAFIFVSHDLGVIKQLCDRVLVMKNGEIVESGETYHIFNRPQDAYTRGLLACRPPLDRRFKRLPTVNEFLELSTQEIPQFLAFHEESTEEFETRINALTDRDVLIDVKNLTKEYPISRNFFGKVTKYKRAVDNVSFTVRKGEIVGLVGESGSGKSTIGHTMLKLLNPTSGVVLYQGNNLFELSTSGLRKYRKDLQIIFQDPFSSLNPKMKIGKAIQEPMQVHNLFNNNKQRKEKVIELLEAVGLQPDHYDRYPHQFSGGQRQRISIARTLSVEPKFIICDESVSALDVSVQAQILNLLKDLKDQFDLSYLFISHDLSVIKFFCDTVLVLKDGKIVERGNVEEVFNSPSNDYTRSLIAAIPK